MRHKTLVSAALRLGVWNNDRLMGGVGSNGYLTWLCDTTNKNVITWGFGGAPQRKVQLFNEPDDQVYIDINPGDWSFQRLSIQEGQSLIAGMTPPTLMGKGYTLVDDPTIGVNKGYVEFYEPNDELQWQFFKAERKGTDSDKLKITKINEFTPASPPDGIMVAQRLRIASPPGQQTFVMKCGSWTKAMDVTVKEGLIVPVCIDIVPVEVTYGGDAYTIIWKHKFRMDIVGAESPVDIEAHNKELLCK
jgi:hypothetical protein